MKLGSFWGITAPMLILGKDLFNDENYLKFISVLNVSGNSVFLEDFLKELKYLQNYVENFPFSYESEYVNDFDTIAGVILNNGKIQNNYSEDTYGLVLDKLRAGVAIKVIQDLQKGKAYYSKEFIMNDVANRKIYNIIKEVCFSEYVELDNVTKIVMKISKRFVDKNTDEPLTANNINTIRDLYNLQTAIPDSIEFNGENVKLNSIDKVFLRYLINNKDFITECFNKVQITKQKEYPMFGTNFHAFMNRNPKSLYYVISKRFDYAKSANINLLRTILKESRDDMQTLNQCIEEHVILCDTEYETLNDVEFDNTLDTLTQDSVKFFNYLRNNDYFCTQDLTRQDLQILIDMYDVVKSLNCSHFSDVLGVQIDEQQFLDLDAKMQKIGIFGLNLYSVFLFREIIKSVMLITSDKIQKTPEQMEMLEVVLSDVQALLDTIIPIGEVIA